MKIKDYISKLETRPKGLLFAAGIILNCLIGYSDYRMGKYLGFEAFYLLPVSMASWFIGRKSGIIMAVISAGVLGVAEMFEHANDEIWSTEAHIVVFGVFAYIISGTKLALQEVSKGKTILSSLLESAGEGIYGIDIKGDHTMVNRAAVQMLGYEVSELIGRHSHSIWHHTRADGTPYPQEQCRIYATLRDGVVKHITDEVFWRKDGSPFPVNYTVAPIWEEGKISGAVIVFRDITEARRAEEALRVSEARYKALYCDNPTMIFTLDTRGTILSVNPFAATQLGYETAELEGKQVSEVVHEEDRTALTEQLGTCLENPGRIYRNKFRKVRKDGTTLWVEETAQSVCDLNGALNVLVVCQDITARKQAEERLIKTMADLARSNKDLEQFAYAVSHDLQAPLRSMSGFAQLLTENYRGKLDADADKHLDFIVAGAKRMQRMIEDILAYSRIGTRAGELTVLNCEAVLNQAIANLHAAIEENGAVVTHGPLPVVKADQSQLVSLLQNLIGNALKFNAGRPQVHVSAVKQAGEWVFSVRDNGIGIDPAQFDRIFMLFQRLHTQEEFQGTGVGLAICKKIVERHGGRIWVESGPEKGTTFYFSLPAGGETEQR